MADEYVFEVEGVGRFKVEFSGAFATTSSIAIRKLIDIVRQYRNVRVYRCEGIVCDKEVE